MKNKIFAMMFALVSLTTFLGAEEIEEKIYIDPSSVVILEEGFYVDVDNVMMGFSSINIDASGMYVLTSHKLSRDWICKCGWRNNYDSLHCRNCGRWR